MDERRNSSRAHTPPLETYQPIRQTSPNPGRHEHFPQRTQPPYKQTDVSNLAQTPPLEFIEPKTSTQRHYFKLTRPDPVGLDASSDSGPANSSPSEEFEYDTESVAEAEQKVQPLRRAEKAQFILEELDSDPGYDRDLEVLLPDHCEDARSENDESKSEISIKLRDLQLQEDKSEDEEAGQERRYRQKKKRWSAGIFKRSHDQSLQSDGSHSDNDPLDDVDPNARRLRRRVRDPRKGSLIFEDRVFSKDHIVEVKEPHKGGVMHSKRAPPSISNDDAFTLYELPFWSELYVDSSDDEFRFRVDFPSSKRAQSSHPNPPHAKDVSMTKGHSTVKSRAVNNEEKRTAPTQPSMEISSLFSESSSSPEESSNSDDFDALTNVDFREYLIVLDQLEKVHEVFEAANASRVVRTHAVNTGSGNTAQSSHVRETSSSHVRRHRPTKGSDDDNDAEDFDDRRKRQKSSKDNEASTGQILKNLACPYFKRCPHRYIHLGKCSGPGWHTFHRLKEHLTRKHRLPIHCPRCKTEFKQETELKTHSEAPERCRVNQTGSFEGMNRDQEEQLRRREYGQNVEKKWRNMYLILFPETVLGHLPSPYYEPSDYTEAARSDDSGQSSSDTSAQDLDAMVRRQLPAKVTDALKTMVVEMRGTAEELIEELLAYRLPGLVRDSYEDISRQYFAETEARASSSRSESSLQRSMSGKRNAQHLHHTSPTQASFTALPDRPPESSQPSMPWASAHEMQNPFMFADWADDATWNFGPFDRSFLDVNENSILETCSLTDALEMVEETAGDMSNGDLPRIDHDQPRPELPKPSYEGKGKARA